MMRKLTVLETTIFPPDNTLATSKARHASHARAVATCTDWHNWWGNVRLLDRWLVTTKVRDRFGA